MHLQKIVIDNFEGIDHFEANFDKTLVRLDSKYAYSVLKAIGVAAKNLTLANMGGIPKICEDTYLCVEIIEQRAVSVTAKGNMNGTITHIATGYKEDFFESIQQSPEQSRNSCFFGNESEQYAKRLQQYKDADKYFGEKGFSNMTNGIGMTRTFRQCLNRYIRDFEPEKLLPDKDRFIVIDSKGEFSLKQEMVLPHFRIGETEKKTLELYSFLFVNEFWKEVETIRNLNHEDWPLFIAGTDKELISSDVMKAFMNRAVKLNRQIFWAS